MERLIEIKNVPKMCIRDRLINSRLSAALQAKGYTDFTKFVDELLSGKDAAQVEFILNKLTTNYTYFMREKEHFAFFNEVILPDLIKRNERKKVLSIWSAGCSTGEEPYTISMCIKDFLGPQAGLWDTRVPVSYTHLKYQR